MKTTPLVSEARKCICGALQILNRKVRIHEQAREVLKKRGESGIGYNIIIKSLWADHGEQNIEMGCVGPLKFALRKAVDAFRQRNKRIDKQWEISIKMGIGDAEYYLEPRQWWATLDEVMADIEKDWQALQAEKATSV